MMLLNVLEYTGQQDNKGSSTEIEKPCSKTTTVLIGGEVNETEKKIGRTNSRTMLSNRTFWEDGNVLSPCHPM